MFQKIKNEQVERAIKLSKDGSATGIDGCPYKLWKALNNRHEKNKENGKPSFDIVKTITMIF